MIKEEIMTEISESVMKFVFDEYSVDCTGCEIILCEENDQEISLEEIVVTVATKSDYLSSDIKKKLKERYGCKVTARLFNGGE